MKTKTKRVKVSAGVALGMILIVTGILCLHLVKGHSEAEIYNQQIAAQLGRFFPEQARREIIKKRLLEDTGKRGKFVKHFPQPDGSYLAIITHLPLHYFNSDTGSWENIDTSIINTIGEFRYGNLTNTLKSFFADPSQNALVKVESEEIWVTWKPERMLYRNKFEEKEIETFNRNAEVILTGSESIAYLDIFENVDELFEVTPGMLKDRIIMKFLHPDIPFNTEDEEFVIQGTLELSQDLLLCIKGIPIPDEYETSSEIELTDEEGNRVLIIGALIVKDSASTPNFAPAFYRIKKKGFSIEFSIVIPLWWLRNPERIFPVIIDPSFYEADMDTYVGSDCGDDNYGGLKKAYLGYKYGPEICSQSIGEGECRMLVHIPLDPWPIPRCLPSSSIWKARLHFNVEETFIQESFNIWANRIEGEWKENDVTWNKQPAFRDDGNERVKVSSQGWWSIDVINSIRNIHEDNTTPYYGFILMSDANQNDFNYLTITTKEADPAFAPYLEIIYTTQCSGANGPCCDPATGCFRGSEYMCSQDDEFRCSDSGCGGDVERREVYQYCSGSSAECNGQIVYTPWVVWENCPEHWYCVVQGNIHTCFSDCSSGECCDGCRYRPSSYQCNTWEEFQCEGFDCGNDVQKRTATQYCSGSNSTCNGSISYGPWTVYQDCSEHEYCDHISHTCQSQCSSGPCCSGCFLLDSTHVCDEQVEYRCTGTNCGDDLERRVVRRYCSGTSPECNGNVEEGPWQIWADCPSTYYCDADNHTCETECSSGACCDGCRYRPVEYVCDTRVEHGCTGTACGDDVAQRTITQYCSGSSSYCDGATQATEWSIIQDCPTNYFCNSQFLDCESQCSSGPCCDGCRIRPYGSPCDDGDLCTVADYCSGEICTGQPKCDDNNSCTTDSCNPATGECTNTPLPAGSPCDDGNPCTYDDACSGGVCVGIKYCSGGACCTSDGCYLTGPCEDGNPCTGPDYCTGMSPDCEPGPPQMGSCDDGDACTVGDYCDGTDPICWPGPETLYCDDGNLCTDDGCDPSSGCIYINNTNPCDDNNVCTTDDICSNGTCSGTPVNCDDGNLCTDDSCDPSSGCVHINNTNSCDDNNACTINDICSNGTCSGSPVDNDKDDHFPTSCGGDDCNDNDSSIYPGATELCNNKDDNCNGTVDEGCPCKPGEARQCGTTDVGECTYGTQTCQSNGTWGNCAGNVEPVTEVCDGKDNDCDGTTDEDGVCGSTACEPPCKKCQYCDNGTCKNTASGTPCGPSLVCDGNGECVSGGGGGEGPIPEEGGCSCSSVGGEFNPQNALGWFIPLVFTFAGLKYKRRSKKR